MQSKSFSSSSAEETEAIGESLGKNLRGGEVLELISDLGGGKTTFVTGLARGFGSDDPVASPSFTISYVYTRADKKALHHFDFYRLNEAGIVANELAEVESDPNIVVAVEWGDIVHDVLPGNRIIIKIESVSEMERKITIMYPEELSHLVSKRS